MSHTTSKTICDVAFGIMQVGHVLAWSLGWNCFSSIEIIFPNVFTESEIHEVQTPQA